MKASVKLNKAYRSKNGAYQVKLIVSHQKKKKLKNIAVTDIRDWDENKQLPKPTHPDFELLYGQIMDIRSKAITRAFRSITDIDQAMAFFLYKPETKSKDFYKFAATEVERMRKLNRKGNADAYKYSVAELKKFAPFLDFDDIDRYLLENFKREKVLAGLKNTSIRTYLYEIRAIYNTAVRLGYCEDKQPFKGLFLDLTVRKRRARNEYLNVESLRKLKNLTDVTAAQRRAIDLSLLQFYLGGLDLIDIYYLQKKQLKLDRLYVKRTKLGNKGYEFDIKVFPVAQLIFDSYTTDKSGYLFPWRKSEIAYKTFRSTHNNIMKRLQKNFNIELMPNGGSLTSKVLRHTFATLAKFKGINEDIIREIMGHERDDMDTVYKDKYPEKVRDSAHLKIISLK